MMYERDENAKRLDAALARVAELEKGTVYVEARQCDECQHVGINDSADGLAACHDCDWTAPEPDEDKCPDCQRENCMAAACPQCGARYVLVASEEIAAPVAQAQHSVPEISGIGRDAEHPRAVVLYLRNEPSEEDMRAIQNFCAPYPPTCSPRLSTARATPRPECARTAGTSASTTPPTTPLAMTAIGLDQNRMRTSAQGARVRTAWRQLARSVVVVTTWSRRRTSLPRLGKCRRRGSTSRPSAAGRSPPRDGRRSTTTSTTTGDGPRRRLLRPGRLQRSERWNRCPAGVAGMALG